MMESAPSQRRLAAIICADVAGYSRLMGEDEHTTLAALTACRDVFSRLVAQFNGRETQRLPKVGGIEVWLGLKYLRFRHAVRDHSHNRCHEDAQASKTRDSPHLSWVHGDSS